MNIFDGENIQGFGGRELPFRSSLDPAILIVFQKKGHCFTK